MKRVSFLILLFTIFLLACSLLEDTVSNTPAPAASPTAVAISLGDSTPTGTPGVRATPTTIATPPGLLTVNSLTTPDVSVTSSNTAANTQKISSGTVDLKVTGFELTRAIKVDAALKDIPVIIVTSLEREEEKAEGIEAGADAYITKSVFNQDTLLDTVERLIR